MGSTKSQLQTSRHAARIINDMASRVRWVGVLLFAVAAGCAAMILRESVEGDAQSSSLRAAWLELEGPHVAAGATLVSDNAAAWAARWEILSTAEESIDASYFIIEDDAFGLAFFGKLLEKAEDGVRVRLLVDARGSRPMVTLSHDFLQELVSSGVDVHIFNPVLPQVLAAFSERSVVPLASGTHNKILVVDGRIALTGGRNISRLYFAARDEDAAAVADADVLLDGVAAVAAVAAVVDDEFNARKNQEVYRDVVNLVSRRDELRLLAAAMDGWAGGEVPCTVDTAGNASALELRARAATGVVDAAAIAAARPRLRAMADVLSVCASLPTLELPRFDVEATVVAGAARAERLDDRVNSALLLAISGAERSIVLESPYFILTPRLLHALAGASGRGVAITLLTNSPLSSDNDLSQALFIDSWPEIVARVPTLRVFVTATPAMQHAKRALFDDVLTFIGSTNIDPFSLHLNSELQVAVWSADFAAQTRADFDSRLYDGSMVEYRVARDTGGTVLRQPAGDADAGAVVIDFGPSDHVAPSDLARLRLLKLLLIGQRRLWDFEVMVW